MLWQFHSLLYKYREPEHSYYGYKYITFHIIFCHYNRIVTFNVQNAVTYTLYIIGLAYQSPSLQILPLESDLIY